MHCFHKETECVKSAASAQIHENFIEKAGKCWRFKQQKVFEDSFGLCAMCITYGNIIIGFSKITETLLLNLLIPNYPTLPSGVTLWPHARVLSFNNWSFVCTLAEEDSLDLCRIGQLDAWATQWRWVEQQRAGQEHPPGSEPSASPPPPQDTVVFTPKTL